MSLSKPEIVAYAGASALLGIVLAIIANKQSKGQEKQKVRDTEEKTVGKELTL